MTTWDNFIQTIRENKFSLDTPENNPKSLLLGERPRTSSIHRVHAGCCRHVWHHLAIDLVPQLPVIRTIDCSISVLIDTQVYIASKVFDYAVAAVVAAGVLNGRLLKRDCHRPVVPENLLKALNLAFLRQVP